jgi:hypothetical protein
MKRHYFFSRVEPKPTERLAHLAAYMIEIDPGVAVRVTLSKRAIDTYMSVDRTSSDLSHYTVIARIGRWLGEAEDWLEAETRPATSITHLNVEPLVAPLEKLAAECERRTAEDRKIHLETKQVIFDHISGPI